MVRDVAFRRLPLLQLLFLEINWEGDVSYTVVCERGPAGEICDVFNVSWPHYALIEYRDIHEKLVEFNILLGKRPNEVMELKAGDREHRLVVEPGIIESVQQVNSTWAGRSQADTQLAGEFGITAGHECRSFFMAHLDKSNLVCVSAKGFHDAIDAIAR